MDGQRFDALTRLLASGGSRRRVLRSIAGLGAGLLVGRGGSAAAQDDPGAASHCIPLLEDCDPNDDQCCEESACDPNFLSCQRTCGLLNDPCADDGDCCSTSFFVCLNGICDVQPGCPGLGQPALTCSTTADCLGCYDTQQGPGFCDTLAGTCSICAPFETICLREIECCPGLKCRATRDCPDCRGICWDCGDGGEACAVDDECCPGLFCIDGTCQTEAPPCIEAGQTCGDGDTCCDDLACVEGICGGPACAEAGEACDGDADCCGDLVCADGVCAVPCLGAGESCAEDPEGCCAGLVCTDGVCAVPETGDATVTIHKATCPTGTGDIFGDCHDNALAGVAFSIAGIGVVTGGNGAAAASVDAGAVTVAEDAGTFADYLGAYVYCSEQNSGTVLYDGSADTGSVTFTVDDGDDVVCDWYNITPADDDDDEDGGDDDDSDDDSGGGTSLPDTGIGTANPSSDAAPWLGAALIGGAAALLAGKRFRDGAASSEPAG